MRKNCIYRLLPDTTNKLNDRSYLLPFFSVISFLLSSNFIDIQKKNLIKDKISTHFFIQKSKLDIFIHDIFKSPLFAFCCYIYIYIYTPLYIPATCVYTDIFHSNSIQVKLKFKLKSTQMLLDLHSCPCVYIRSKLCTSLSLSFLTVCYVYLCRDCV